MKTVFLTNIISPHQLLLAKAFIQLVGKENYRYIKTRPKQNMVGGPVEIDGLVMRFIEMMNRDKDVL